MKRKDNLIWIDLEMTGLDVKREVIIEIGTVVTDAELKVLAKGPALAIFQPEKYLAEMDGWNTKQHNESGLVKRVRHSQLSTQAAEAQTIAFLEHHIAKGLSPMCGNTISQDRRFLEKYMPTLAEYFHYRQIDVSTLKELAKRWAPNIAKGAKKQSKHLVMDDIMDSIEELRYYRQHMMTC
jgi:oligoribonuclease